MKFHERLICKILKTGPIPEHIAFIMDGNRRHATRIGLKKTQGHERGFESLKRCLEYCLELGVKKVSVYALAIDNLKREKEEVDVLMDLARKKLDEISQNEAFLQKHDIRVKVCGNISLAPQDVQTTMQEVEKRTEKNQSLLLNIAFCYDSTYEMERLFNKYYEDHEKNGLNNEEVELSSKRLLNKYLLIPNEPDILVRTSNEIRLSDFMTFQSGLSMLTFLEENWPEMSIWSILKIILRYQVEEKNFLIIKESIEKNAKKVKEVLV